MRDLLTLKAPKSFDRWRYLPENNNENQHASVCNYICYCVYVCLLRFEEESDIGVNGGIT
jgi:hypothetical protein